MSCQETVGTSFFFFAPPPLCATGLPGPCLSPGVSIFTECIAVPGTASYVYISPYRFVAIKAQNQVRDGILGRPEPFSPFRQCPDWVGGRGEQSRKPPRHLLCGICLGLLVRGGQWGLRCRCPGRCWLRGLAPVPWVVRPCGGPLGLSFPPPLCPSVRWNCFPTPFIRCNCSYALNTIVRGCLYWCALCCVECLASVGNMAIVVECVSVCLCDCVSVHACV